MRYRNNNKPSSAPVIEKECTHYWLIESADGPISQGVCKFCGARKEFHNSWLGFAIMNRGAESSDKKEEKLDEPELEKDDSAV